MGSGQGPQASAANLTPLGPPRHNETKPDAPRIPKVVSSVDSHQEEADFARPAVAEQAGINHAASPPMATMTVKSAWPPHESQLKSAIDYISNTEQPLAWDAANPLLAVAPAETTSIAEFRHHKLTDDVTPTEEDTESVYPASPRPALTSPHCMVLDQPFTDDTLTQAYDGKLEGGNSPSKNHHSKKTPTLRDTRKRSSVQAQLGNPASPPKYPKLVSTMEATASASEKYLHKLMNQAHSKQGSAMTGIHPDRLRMLRDCSPGAAPEAVEVPPSDQHKGGRKSQASDANLVPLGPARVSVSVNVGDHVKVKPKVRINENNRSPSRPRYQEITARSDDKKPRHSEKSEHYRAGASHCLHVNTYNRNRTPLRRGEYERKGTADGSLQYLDCPYMPDRSYPHPEQPKRHRAGNFGPYTGRAQIRTEELSFSGDYIHSCARELRHYDEKLQHQGAKPFHSEYRYFHNRAEQSGHEDEHARRDGGNLRYTMSHEPRLAAERLRPTDGWCHEENRCEKNIDYCRKEHFHEYDRQNHHIGEEAPRQGSRRGHKVGYRDEHRCHYIEERRGVGHHKAYHGGHWF